MKMHEDVLFSSEGDILIDTIKSDIADTNLVDERNLIQRIMTRIISSPGDWKSDAGLGVSYESILGKINNAENGKKLERMILNSLIYDNFLNIGNVKVESYPVSKRALGALVMISGVSSKAIMISIIYDIRDNRLIGRKL
jgi:hypothetical protein